PGLVIMQTVEKSHKDTPYVVSAYLRSDASSNVILGSNFTKQNCAVGPRWSRCAAPVAIGDGSGYIQFQLRTVGPGDALDLKMAGPQVEVGLAPTRYRGTTSAPVMQSISASLTALIEGKKWEEAVSSRRAHIDVALQSFALSPLVGLGRTRVSE